MPRFICFKSLLDSLLQGKGVFEPLVRFLVNLFKVDGQGSALFNQTLELFQGQFLLVRLLYPLNPLLSVLNLRVQLNNFGCLQTVGLCLLVQLYQLCHFQSFFHRHLRIEFLFDGLGKVFSLCQARLNILGHPYSHLLQPFLVQFQVFRA